VLTGRREVAAMLDLVKQETERIESRFLSRPAATGIFWRKFWERKLRVVESRYGKSQLEFGAQCRSLPSPRFMALIFWRQRLEMSPAAF